MRWRAVADVAAPIVPMAITAPPAMTSILGPHGVRALATGAMEAVFKNQLTIVEVESSILDNWNLQTSIQIVRVWV